MFNFTVIAKLLEIAGESEEVKIQILLDLVEVINKKFINDFVIYANERVRDDYQLEQLRDLVENADGITPEKMDVYKKWLENNVEFDMDEFWDQFDEDMRKMEMEFINKVKDKLTDEQKDELLKFMDDQNAFIKDAYQEIDAAFVKENDAD